MHDEASKVVFNSPRRRETTSHSKGQACANSNTIKRITIKIPMASMSVMAGPTHTAGHGRSTWGLYQRRQPRSKAIHRLVVRSSSEGHKLGQVCAEAFTNRANRPFGVGAMRGLHNSS